MPLDRTSHCVCNCSHWSIKTNQQDESSSKQAMPNAGVAHFIFPINSFSCYSFLFSLLHIMDDSSRLLILYQWIELASLSLWTTLVSDSRRSPVKVRGPRSYCWRDMPNEILIPLQSLISCFLEPPANRRAAGGTIRDSGEATPQHVPKALSAGPQ